MSTSLVGFFPPVGGSGLDKLPGSGEFVEETPKKAALLLEFGGSFRFKLLVKLGNAGILHVDTSPATPFAWLEKLKTKLCMKLFPLFHLVIHTEIRL